MDEKAVSKKNLGLYFIPCFKIWLYFTILRGIFGVKLLFFQERLSQKGLNSCSMGIWLVFKPFQSIFVIADKDDDISLRISQQKQLKCNSHLLWTCVNWILWYSMFNTCDTVLLHCISVIHFIQINFCLWPNWPTCNQRYIKPVLFFIYAAIDPSMFSHTCLLDSINWWYIGKGTGTTQAASDFPLVFLYWCECMRIHNLYTLFSV